MCEKETVDTCKHHGSDFEFHCFVFSHGPNVLKENLSGISEIGHESFFTVVGLFFLIASCVTLSEDQKSLIVTREKYELENFASKIGKQSRLEQKVIISLHAILGNNKFDSDLYRLSKA